MPTVFDAFVSPQSVVLKNIHVVANAVLMLRHEIMQNNGRSLKTSRLAVSVKQKIV
jgi:hypothetical protein